MTAMGQKCPKQLRLPASKNSHEHMGRIVPIAVFCSVLKKPIGVPDREPHGPEGKTAESRLYQRDMPDILV
jgi:hypothetical protein